MPQGAQHCAFAVKKDTGLFTLKGGEFRLGHFLECLRRPPRCLILHQLHGTICPAPDGPDDPVTLSDQIAFIQHKGSILRENLFPSG